MQHHELKLDGYKANLTVEGHRLDSLRVPSMPWHPCTNFCFFLLNINYREIKSTQLNLHPTLTTCLSWCFILTRCCVPNWGAKILTRAISNVVAGRRFPTPDLEGKIWQRDSLLCATFDAYLFVRWNDQ